MKNHLFRIISLVLIFSFLAIAGEIGIRVYHHFKGRKMVLDKELGWLPGANYVFNGEKVDASGQTYSVTFQTDNRGFRLFGNHREANKKKVLFIGDSFTHAVEVSNDKTYYGILKDTLPIEVFAFGGGGYGTLQEYMILEKYLDDVKPDAIVLQLSSNDFINNHYELEARSARNNNGMRRPYLTKNGEIIYKLPKSFSIIRDIAYNHLRFFNFIFSRIDRLNFVLSANSVEDIIKKRGRSYPYFSESVEITEQLIKKIKARVPATTSVFAFAVDDNKPFHDEFKRIMEKNEIDFIDGVPQAVRAAEQQGVETRAADTFHWNNTGHQIAANVLKHYFEVNWRF